MTHHCGCHKPPVTWTGARACHCSRSDCGLTFSGVGGFDYHQVGDRCRSRREMQGHGYRQVRPGVLGRPIPEPAGAPKGAANPHHDPTEGEA